MANIKLNSLAKPKNIDTKPQYTYSDIAVDLKFDQLKQVELYSNLYEKDLRGSYDLGAIKNSIINIFTSFPGDKVLNPEFGLNLNQFLFLPCSVDTAQSIGNLIKNQLIKQEPRVIAREINVFADVENDQYLITMVLEVPFINNNNRIAFKALLNSTGINFYN
jgi:phage baseplate assembly protein W